jgi:hypothetical protein
MAATSRESPPTKESQLTPLTQQVIGSALSEHRKFPQPLVFLEENGAVELMDGNHRMLAYLLARGKNPESVDAIQPVWLGMPGP